jgi:hypothetical protein
LFILVASPAVASAPALEDSIVSGVEWLVKAQGADGSWDEGLFWSTSDAILALQNQEYVDASSEIDSGLHWISRQTIDNTDFLSRRVLITHEGATQLGLLQNTDGGWGYNEHYKSSIIDTSLVLKAIVEAGHDPPLVDTGVHYLVELQGPEGSYFSDGQPDYLSTAIAAEVLGRSSFLVVNDTLLFNEEAYKSGYKSFAFLNENRGQLVGNLVISHALKAALYNDYSPDLREELVDRLLGNQNTDGSWGFTEGENGSSYSTAVSLLALGEYRSASLGLEVKALELKQEGNTINPGLIKAGEEYQVTVYVSNPTRETRGDIIVVGKVVRDGSIIRVLPPKLVQVFSADSAETLTLEFSTDYLPEDGSTLIVELRDHAGKVIHARDMQLNVSATKKVRISRLNVIPGSADINSVVEFYVSLENTGNQGLMDAEIKVDVHLPNQTVVWSSSRNISLGVGAGVYLGVGALFTAGLGYGDYSVLAKVYDEGVLVDGGIAYSLLSIGPRISVSKNINATMFPPGPSAARVNITLAGATGKPPADVVVLADNTNASGLGDVKKALAAFTSSLKEDDRIALVSVSDTVQVLQGLTPDRNLVLDAISNITPGAPELHLGAGINASVDVLLGQGRSNNNWYIFTVARTPSIDDPLGAVEHAASHGIPVYLIIYAEAG